MPLVLARRAPTSTQRAASFESLILVGTERQFPLSVSTSTEAYVMNQEVSVPRRCRLVDTLLLFASIAAGLWLGRVYPLNEQKVLGPAAGSW
jgi:hypothetical protein